MKRICSVLFLAFSFGLILSLAGCGGGGGGGGGSVEDGTQRTSGTGVRVLHAGLDIEPVDLKVGINYLSRVAFMDVDFISGTDSGAMLVELERANTPGTTFFSSSLALTDKTEYSLLLSGQASNNNFVVSVLEEPVVRPEAGRARVQLVNLLEGSRPLILNGTGVTLGPVPFRLASGYSDIASGPQTFTITNDRGGVVSTITTALADRGELTVVLGGSASQGAVFTRLYPDLD